jgi:hypothetical protein
MHIHHASAYNEMVAYFLPRLALAFYLATPLVDGGQHAERTRAGRARPADDDVARRARQVVKVAVERRV